VKPSPELRAVAENAVTVLKWEAKFQSKPSHNFAWGGRIFRVVRAGDNMLWTGHSWWYLSYGTEGYDFKSADIRWKGIIPTPYLLAKAVLEVTERLDTESVVKGWKFQTVFFNEPRF
jgi:hypothetical protein